MKKPTTKRPAAKSKRRPFFLDIIFTNYRKYRNHKRYVHTDLL
jgi:hypothetical protein